MTDEVMEAARLLLQDPRFLQARLSESLARVEALKGQVEAMAPKVAVHDQFIRSEKQYSITDVARHYGVQPTKHLIPYLRRQGYLLDRAGCIPSSKAIQAGIMLERENILEGIAYPQAVVTAQMFERWARIIENMKVWRDGE